MWPFSTKDPQKFVSKKFEKILVKAVRQLDNSPIHYFTDECNVEGNGVYAIYFHGFLDRTTLYKWLPINYPQTSSIPLYVGKSVPRGWRSSRRDRTSSNLQKRLNEHATSIEQADNLRLLNFHFKYITLNPDLIASVEAEAIREFQPLWNVAIEGFGNHNVGRNRLGQIKSEWDVIHPGRPWAEQMSGRNVEEVKTRVLEKLGY